MRLLNLFIILSMTSSVVAEVPRLSLPDNVEAQNLPGISLQADSFSIDELEAPMIVLVVFDFYCPVCQKSAANIKRLAEKVAATTPGIPVIGIGTGDTPFETQKFKDKFKLPFPCLSDREETVSKYYHVERTPSIMVLSKSGEENTLTELYRNEGYLGREHIDGITALLKEDT